MLLYQKLVCSLSLKFMRLLFIVVSVALLSRLVQWTQQLLSVCWKDSVVWRHILCDVEHITVCRKYD